MKKATIRNTAVLYWSEKYKQYIVESPLLDGVSGVGDTEVEAWHVFNDLLADAYEAYLEGRMSHVYDKPGRPAKGTVSFNADIKPDSRSSIKLLAKKLGCTQGEMIDYLLFFHKVNQQEKRDQSAKIPHSAIRLKTNKPTQFTLDEFVRMVKEEVIQELKPTKLPVAKRKKSVVRY